MNPKTIIIACALATAALSFSAFADEGAVCSNPLKTICTNTAPQRAQRDAYIKALKAEIAAEASKAAEPRIEAMKKQVSILHPIRRVIQSYKIKNQEIMSSAKKRVGDIETVVTNPANVALLKNYMVQAIDESQFDSATKDKFKESINSIVIGTFADYIEKSGLEDSVLAQLLGNACGSDGMVSNAFATMMGEERYVLICPGFLIALSQTASAEERFNSILQAISHEMGHHIDNSKVGNALYQPYLSCLADNYSDKFTKSKADEKFCKKNEKDPGVCRAKVALSHSGELIADAWGIKVLAIHARAQKYSLAQTDGLLTASWANLCGTGDEGIHPTGDFRIGTLLRVNPDISDVLSCNNSGITRPACTIDGAVTL